MQVDERKPNDDNRHAIGKLCVGGDWACTTGDVGTLAHIAAQLAAYAPEPLHGKLAMLADLCRCAPDGAVAMWLQVKDALRHGDVVKQ